MSTECNKFVIKHLQHTFDQIGKFTLMVLVLLKKRYGTYRELLLIQPSTHSFDRWRNPKFDKYAVPGYGCQAMSGQLLDNLIYGCIIS